MHHPNKVSVLVTIYMHFLLCSCSYFAKQLEVQRTETQSQIIFTKTFRFNVTYIHLQQITLCRQWQSGCAPALQQWTYSRNEHQNMRSEVPVAVTAMVLFWVWHRVNTSVDAYVSEKHTACIFRAELAYLSTSLHGAKTLNNIIIIIIRINKVRLTWRMWNTWNPASYSLQNVPWERERKIYKYFYHWKLSNWMPKSSVSKWALTGKTTSKAQHFDITVSTRWYQKTAKIDKKMWAFQTNSDFVCILKLVTCVIETQSFITADIWSGSSTFQHVVQFKTNIN